MDSRRAEALGIMGDLDVETLIRDYIADFPDAVKPGLQFTPR